jgi:MFS family permease
MVEAPSLAHGLCVGSLADHVIFWRLFADRFGARGTLIAEAAVPAMAISLYLVVHSLAAFHALSVIFGLTDEGIMPLRATLVREYFGARIMGTVFGVVPMQPIPGMATFAFPFFIDVVTERPVSGQSTPPDRKAGIDWSRVRPDRPGRRTTFPSN